MSSPDETSRCLRNQQDRLIWRRVFLQALAYALANGLPLHLTEYRKTQIFSVSVFEKIELQRAFPKAQDRITITEDCNLLPLFDF